MNSILENYNFPKITLVEVKSLNRSFSIEEIKLGNTNKEIPYTKALGPEDFTGELYQLYFYETIIK